MPEENQDYNPDLVTVSDDNGQEITFEILDRIEDDDDKRYVALIPYYDPENPDEILEGSAELIVLRVKEDPNDGDSYLYPIDDEDEFNRISRIFEERLSDYYEILDEDDSDTSDSDNVDVENNSDN